MVGDVELTGSGVVAGALFEFDAAAFDGEVEVIASLAGVAAGFGVASGAHGGDAEREEGVAEGGRFAGAEDDAGVREADAEGADELDEGAVIEPVLRFEAAGGWAESGEGDGAGGFPALGFEVFEVSAEAEGFLLPVGEAEEGAETETAETAGVAAFRAIEAPVEVFFGACGVVGGVGFAAVGFLVDDEAFGSALDHPGVFGGFHGADLDGEGGDFFAEGGEAGFEVAVADEFGVFAGDEEDVAEAEGEEVFGFADDLRDAEGDAEDRVVAGEAAVGAVIDALVGEVEWCEEAHGAPEVLAGDPCGVLGHLFEGGRGFWFEEGGELPLAGRRASQPLLEELRECHGGGFHRLRLGYFQGKTRGEG